MSAELDRWQKAEARIGRDVTLVGDCKHEQFGTATRPLFGFKGGETNWILEFLTTQVLPLKFHKLENGPNILDAGQRLLNLLKLIRSNPVVLDASSVQQFHDDAKAYLRLMKDLCFCKKPKDHF